MLMKDKIRELRKQHKLSQRRLSIILDTMPCCIHNWESGKFTPSLYYLIKMADLFNVSLDELCCRDFTGGKQNG